MIHNIRPDLVDMDQIRRQQARISLEQAFSTAESHLGIPRLLDPEGITILELGIIFFNFLCFYYFFVVVFDLNFLII